MVSPVISLDIDYQPSFPKDFKPGVGVIGVGNIVRNAHLKAYSLYNVNVVGVYDVNPKATENIEREFGIRVFDSVDALINHPDVVIVDVTPHPKDRVPLVKRALQAGKHVLSQKPLASTLAEARELIELADRQSVRLAVNQNGRWSPPWRIATLLIQQGIIGDVLEVTHLFDNSFAWTMGTTFDSIRQFAIYDYAVHWFDITRCWLENKIVDTVRAREYRPPNQPSEAKTPWAMWSEIAYTDGTNAMIRGGGVSVTSKPSHLFWIHGTQGVIRGSNLRDDWVELERDGEFTRFDLQGNWFPNGFAGTLGELAHAIAENREPWNSAKHNYLSLKMTLAACRSADLDGQPIKIQEFEG